MTISREQVQRVATLARLTLGESDIEEFTSQLNHILHFAEKLNQLDTEGVESTSHVLPMINVWREDEVVPSLGREKALFNAPDREEGLFKVPAVFTEE